MFLSQKSTFIKLQKTENASQQQNNDFVFGFLLIC